MMNGSGAAPMLIADCGARRLAAAAETACQPNGSRVTKMTAAPPPESLSAYTGWLSGARLSLIRQPDCGAARSPASACARKVPEHAAVTGVRPTWLAAASAVGGDPAA